MFDFRGQKDLKRANDPRPLDEPQAFDNFPYKLIFVQRGEKKTAEVID
jgi:hypothetical protein